MTSKNYLIATLVVFDVVALLQLARLIMGWPVNIGGFEVPMFASAIAFVIASAMAVWAFLLLRDRPA